MDGPFPKLHLFQQILTLFGQWLPDPSSLYFKKLYDIGGDGVIRPDEMTQIAQAMYDLHGTKESAEDHVKEIFAKMDTDSNGHVTKEEFLKGILQDAYIRQWSQGSSANSENQNVTIVVDKPNNPIMEDCSVSASS